MATASSIKKTTLTPQRKHRKLLKDGSGAEVWPESIEAVFVQGLREYWDSPYATYSQPRGRSRWRNQYLVDYLHKAGIERTKKQVASHIQVLRNMWKGEPEFYLVAAGDEASSTDTAPIKFEDRCDITALIPLDFDEGDGSSSAAPSPEFSPMDHQSDFPPTPTNLADSLLPLPPTSTKDKLAYSTSVLSTSIPNAMSIYPLDTVKHHSHDNSPLGVSYYSLDASPFSDLTPPTKQQQQPSYLTQYPNYCTAFRLLAAGMTPFSVKLDTLSQPQPGSALMLKIKLSITSVDDTRCLSTLHGFSGGISLARVWSNSAKCITRVYTQNVCLSEEASPLDISNVEYGIANIILPESSLSRCRWLDQSMQACITQEIIVDNETLIYVIYNLDRSRGALPSAELLGYITRKAAPVAPTQPGYPLVSPTPTSYAAIPSTLSSTYTRYSTQTSLSNALTPPPSLSSAASVY